MNALLRYLEAERGRRFWRAVSCSCVRCLAVRWFCCDGRAVGEEERLLWDAPWRCALEFVPHMVLQLLRSRSDKLLKASLKLFLNLTIMTRSRASTVQSKLNRFGLYSTRHTKKGQCQIYNLRYSTQEKKDQMKHVTQAFLLNGRKIKNKNSGYQEKIGTKSQKFRLLRAYFEK